MPARKLLGALLLAALAATVTPAAGQPAPKAATPADSRAFHWKGGTGIERAANTCDSNIDWLLVRAPGIAEAKSIDVSPKVSQAMTHGSFPSTNCAAPDCVPVYVKVTSRDAAGARTLTAKAPGGRTFTTTFEVVENAGRCDYPKK